MKKIPTLFVRDPATNLRYVLPEVHPGCEWVLAGEGIATRKYDGTCCLVRDGKLYKRHEVKPGKATPPNFEAVETDPNTGKTVGWVPVGQGPEDKWHRDAWDRHSAVTGGLAPKDGTYELIGPKVQGNPEHAEVHGLIPHGEYALENGLDVSVPRDFEGLHQWLNDHTFEGIVWHHPDGRMAKIKKRDFPR